MTAHNTSPPPPLPQDLRKVTELVAGAELQLPQRVRAWQLLLSKPCGMGLQGCAAVYPSIHPQHFACLPACNAGIAAVSSDTADAVAQQRQTQYEDLRHAVAVLEPSLNVPPVDPEKRLVGCPPDSLPSPTQLFNTLPPPLMAKGSSMSRMLSWP